MQNSMILNSFGQGFRQKVLCRPIAQMTLIEFWFFFSMTLKKYCCFKYRQPEIPRAWKIHSNTLLGRGWSNLSVHVTQWKKNVYSVGFGYKSNDSWLFRIPCQKKQLCVTFVKASVQDLSCELCGFEFCMFQHSSAGLAEESVTGNCCSCQMN